MLALEKDLRDDWIQLPLFTRKPRSKGEVAHSFLAEHAPFRKYIKTKAGKCTHTRSHAHVRVCSLALLLILSLSQMRMRTPPCPSVLSKFSQDDILVRRGGSSF